MKCNIPSAGLGALLGAAVVILLNFVIPARPEGDSVGEKTGDSPVCGNDEAWLTDSSALPVPFSKPVAQRSRRAGLPKEARAAIVFNPAELLTASDYVEVLESLAKDDPGYLYAGAIKAHSLCGTVAMRCVFSHEKDFNIIAAHLGELYADSEWRRRLSSITDEVCRRPGAGKCDAFLEILSRSGLENRDLRFKASYLLQERAEADLAGTFQFLQGRPELAQYSGGLYQKWGKLQSTEAVDWVRSNLNYSSPSDVISQTQQVLSGVCESGNIPNVRSSIEAVQAVNSPNRGNLEAHVLKQAVALGSPDDWILYVKQMLPSYKKDGIALALGIRLDRAGAAPADWVKWFEEMGAREPQTIATGIEFARKRP